MSCLARRASALALMSFMSTPYSESTNLTGHPSAIHVRKLNLFISGCSMSSNVLTGHQSELGRISSVSFGALTCICPPEEGHRTGTAGRRRVTGQGQQGAGGSPDRDSRAPPSHPRAYSTRTAYRLSAFSRVTSVIIVCACQAAAQLDSPD